MVRSLTWIFAAMPVFAEKGVIMRTASAWSISAGGLAFRPTVGSIW